MRREDDWRALFHGLKLVAVATLSAVLAAGGVIGLGRALSPSAGAAEAAPLVVIPISR